MRCRYIRIHGTSCLFQFWKILVTFQCKSFSVWSYKLHFAHLKALKVILRFLRKYSKAQGNYYEMLHYVFEVVFYWPRIYLPLLSSHWSYVVLGQLDGIIYQIFEDSYHISMGFSLWTINLSFFFWPSKDAAMGHLSIMTKFCNMLHLIHLFPSSSSIVTVAEQTPREENLNAQFRICH